MSFNHYKRIDSIFKVSNQWFCKVNKIGLLLWRYLSIRSSRFNLVPIAPSIHSSRNTVSEVLTLASNLLGCWVLDDDVTNQSLESLFYPGWDKDNEERLISDHPKFHRKLAPKGLFVLFSGQNTVWKPVQLEKSHTWAHSLMITIISELVLPR